MFIGLSPKGSSGDVFLEGYKSDGWEIDFVENLEMLVVGNQVFCLTANGTIDKLVIVGIARNQIESPNWCHTNEVTLIEKGLDDGIGKEWRCLCRENLLVLHQDFIRDANLDFLLQKISPNLVVWTLRRKDCQQAIRVDYNTSHHLAVS